MSNFGASLLSEVYIFNDIFLSCEQFDYHSLTPALC